MDYEKQLNLHTIVMLRDVIRKWWRCELGLADKTGAVIDWQKGETVAQNFTTPNDFCRLSLFSKEGFRRCCTSLKVLNDKFRNSRKLRRALTHDCHLGFTIVGAPIFVGGEYEGFVFV